jgi:hypothetical protein
MSSVSQSAMINDESVQLRAYTPSAATGFVNAAVLRAQARRGGRLG